MKYCQECGGMNAESMTRCRKCGARFPGMNYGGYYDDDESHAGLCVLSFFFPIFGIFYCALKSVEKPRRARGCAIAVLISWAVNLVLTLIFIFAFYGILLSAFMY